MVVSDRPLTTSPWTVVLQGTPLTYDDATVLDKLEYALRVGGPAIDRHLSQPSVVKGLAQALVGAAIHVRNADSLIRAGKLLAAIIEFISAKHRSKELHSFLSGLPESVFEPFLSTIGQDKEVSSWYLSAIGTLLGQSSLYSSSISKSQDVIKAQVSVYMHEVTRSLASTAEECVTAHQDDEEDAPDVVGNVFDNLPTNVISSSVATPRSPVLQAASSLGYIPTVPGIGESVPLNVGDEQLGRVLKGLAAFLAREENRVALCTVRPAAGPPTSILASLLDKEVGAPVQVYYQTAFCLWLLSFSGRQDDARPGVEEIAAAVEEAGVPRRLTHVLRDVGSEKVVRICLATLRNILDMSPTLRKEMVGAGLVDVLQSPSFRRLDDDDIREDLGVLANALESELSSMSSFDVYKAEVLSGALEWTPAHRDELFWRENVEKLERNQQEVLRCLVRLLLESSDETVLAVACSDLAQFIKFHPRGRAIAQSLGVKARLMQLMVTGEGDVRRYALNCVQVLMIRWTRHPS